MAYIGNTPAENYASFLTETFSVSATASYTLSHAVSNENDIRLVINGVVQQPGSGKAYTASGTTLTLTSATASGDVMYCVYLGRALQTVNPPNASVGTAQLASEAVTNAKVASTIITGQTAETSIATDDLILLSDTSASGALKKMTRANFVSGLGSVAGELAFRVTKSGAQTISSGTTTVITFDTETFDIGSGFASNKFTVPSGKDGVYFFHFLVITNENIGGDKFQASIRVNGGGVSFTANSGGSGSYRAGNTLSALANLSAGDYVDCDVFQQHGTVTISGGSFCTFQGFRIS